MPTKILSFHFYRSTKVKSLTKKPNWKVSLSLSTPWCWLPIYVLTCCFEAAFSYKSPPKIETEFSKRDEDPLKVQLESVLTLCFDPEDWAVWATLGIELESRIFESLFQRRMLKAPLVPFIRLLHSKCCSCGHFEMCMNSVGLFVQKLWAFSNSNLLEAIIVTLGRTFWLRI